MKVSVLILTYNEEQNLPACLAALTWCDDIWVLDSGSTDATARIAHEAGAKLLVRSFDDFASQRNFGLENCSFTNEWVLHLDADEVVTPEFSEALLGLSPQSGIAAYHVPSKLILFGSWLKFAGMYPVYQVRLGHRDRLRFVQVGHGQQENLPPSVIATFPEPYLHYNFSHGMRRWLEKHLRYAQDEAAVLIRQRTEKRSRPEGSGPVAGRRAAKAAAARLPLWLRPPARFFYVYLYRQGFRDGITGFTYAFMLAVYEGMIVLYVLEARNALQGRGMAR